MFFKVPALDEILKIIRCNCKSTSHYTFGTTSCAYQRNSLKRKTTCGDGRGFGCNNRNLLEPGEMRPSKVEGNKIRFLPLTILENILREFSFI